MDTIKRILSIQSHVVSGYVGNKSATFPLQLLGFDVDAINSVQFSNHAGYPTLKGQVLNESNLSELIDGLRSNNLLNYSHLLTGYMGSPSFLQKVSEVIREVKKINPNAIYVCDPVMGDDDKMYVPPELLPIYKNEIINQADILTPNQFEIELLTDIKIVCENDALEAMNQLHNNGIPTVVITSTKLGNKDVLVTFASTVKGESTQLRLDIPRVPHSFTGTGDLFAALLLAWMSKTNNLKQSCENTINTMQMVLKLTYENAKNLAGPDVEKFRSDQIELRIIHSRDFILNPKNELQAVVFK